MLAADAEVEAEPEADGQHEYVGDAQSQDLFSHYLGLEEII